MTEPLDQADAAPRPSRQAMIQVGAMRVTGPAALAVMLLVPVVLVVLLVWSRASLRMMLSGAIWIGFTVYWTVAARSKAPTERSESAASRAVHTRLMNAALLLLFVPVPGLRTRFLPLAPAVVISGFAVQLLFLLLAVWARRILGRNWSASITMALDHQLIRSGPYRRIRHPIYTAVIGMFLGTAVVSGEVHALLAVLLIAGAYWRKIRLEERTLREIFGLEYGEYVRDTNALIPFVV